ncbi:hypothetical protein EAF00_010236 [Botryotinia globosa]|nr:hypothetical protein EAF00_010236 [Botryotinia globosa]
MADTQTGTNGHAGTPYEDGRSNGSTRLTIEKSRQEEQNTDGTLRYDWDGENDPEKSVNEPPSPKSVLIVPILFGLPAGAYGAGNDEMSALFNFSNSGFPYSFFATPAWNIGATIFPLLFVPLTETSGPQNFETMVVCRFFGVGASSVAINIVGGTISDVWKGPQQRSLPLYLFGTTSVIGIALRPFVGGAITSTYPSFRLIYWVLLITTGGILPVFWFLLVETRGDITLAREAKKWRKNNPDKEPRYAEAEIDVPSVATRLMVSFKRPVKMLCTKWVVFSQTLWVSFAWGLLFLFQSSVTQTFSTNYNYNTFQTSLIQLSLSVGAIIATFVNPIQDHLYLQSAKRAKTGTPITEARLYSSIPGSLLFAAGLFWYGWSSYPSLPWIVPTLGIGCVGFGIYSIYLAVVNYLTDSYEKIQRISALGGIIGEKYVRGLLATSKSITLHKLRVPMGKLFTRIRSISVKSSSGLVVGQGGGD